MTNTEIATTLTGLAKSYTLRGNKAYASALRRQAGQARKGAVGNWSSIIRNAQNGL